MNIITNNRSLSRLLSHAALVLLCLSCLSQAQACHFKKANKPSATSQGSTDSTKQPASDNQTSSNNTQSDTDRQVLKDLKNSELDPTEFPISVY
jgi:hypothetical protein